MIGVTHSGDFKNIDAFFKRIFKSDSEIRRILEYYGPNGVDALTAATPIDSGMTANSWGYEIRISRNAAQIWWTNSNNEFGVPVAILLQYGHATGNGGFVLGNDYINPALKSIFDNIADEIWREVTRNG